jgi:hypothetical protein
MKFDDKEDADARALFKIASLIEVGLDYSKQSNA